MCDPISVSSLLVGTAASAGTAGAAATAATAGLIGAGGAVTATGALTGLSMLGTGAGLYGQQRAANAQEHANAVQRENSITARNANLAQIEVQKAQASTQAGEKQFQNNLQARQAMSTAKVSAGESGVSGLSVDALMAEMDARRANYNDSVEANLRNNVIAYDNQRDNVQTAAVNQVNSLKAPTAPDYWGAALRIGGGYVERKTKEEGTEWLDKKLKGLTK